MPTLATRRHVAVALLPVLLASALLGQRPRGLGAGAAPSAVSEADGARTRPIAVLVVPAPDVAPSAAAVLRARLAHRLLLVGVPAVAGRVPAPPEPSVIEALRGMLAAGLAAYEALDAVQAAERLEAVTAALEADERLADLAPDLLDAPVYLGLVTLGLGDRHGAGRAFERALRLSPARSLRPGRFAPSVEEAYALAQIRLTAVRPSLLRLAAVPDGAELYVEGVYRGRTPLAIDPPGPGRYVLLAQAPGVGVTTRQLRITELGPEIIDVVVPAGPAVPSLAGLATTIDGLEPAETFPPGAASGLAGILGADRLLLVRLEGASAGFRALAGLVDLTTGEWVADGPAGEEAEAAALGDLVADWLAETPEDRPRPADGLLATDWREPGDAATDGLAPGALPSGLDDGSGRLETRPWYRRWYVWLLVGAGLAAGLAAAAGSGGGGGNGTGSVSIK